MPELPLINTIVLKIASRCNIDCTYCYEYNRGDESWRRKPKSFSSENARALAVRINEYSLLTGVSSFNISLHGGEPTLVGATALRSILCNLRDHCSVKLRFGMQTNGTLLKDDLIEVLKEFSVRVAVSLDGGPRHNRFRVDHKGQPTWARAVDGINRLKEADLFSGIQAVIDLSSDPGDVMEVLLGFDPPEIELGQPFGTYDNPPAIPAGGMTLGRWLCGAFDKWTSSPRGGKSKVIILQDVLVAILTGHSNSEWFSNKPPGYIIVSTDGSFEGLDTLKVVGDEGRVLGLHLSSSSINDALMHPRIRERQELSIARPTSCRDCAILEWCNGGYYPTRYRKENGFDNPSIYCADWKLLFTHVGYWIAVNHDDPIIQNNVRNIIETLRRKDLVDV